jgi:hypothetical protein
MNYQDLQLILRENEHTHLDFKLLYGGNPDFVHDIICMANVLGDKPRHLVFGVNDQKEIVGLADDQKKALNNIIDTLRGAKLNFMPHLELFNCICPDEKVVQILRVHGDSYKPYWLTQDYTFQGRTIRAGVIYTRLGDRNVAPNESTPEKLIESMFRERFGLDKSPLDRFKIYIKDSTNWKHDHDSIGGYYYCLPFPEFTIRQLDHELEQSTFFEPWTLLFPDQKAFRYEYEVKYHATKLFGYYEVTCDGGRFNTVMPEYKANLKFGNEMVQSFYLDTSKIQFDIHKMMRSLDTYFDNRSLYLKLPEFSSKSEADHQIGLDYEQNHGAYQYFFFDKSKHAYCTLNAGKTEEISLGPSCPDHLVKTKK